MAVRPASRRDDGYARGARPTIEERAVEARRLARDTVRARPGAVKRPHY
jgi:hypothetical protein